MFRDDDVSPNDMPHDGRRVGLGVSSFVSCLVLSDTVDQIGLRAHAQEFRVVHLADERIVIRPECWVDVRLYANDVDEIACRVAAIPSVWPDHPMTDCSECRTGAETTNTTSRQATIALNEKKKDMANHASCLGLGVLDNFDFGVQMAFFK